MSSADQRISQSGKLAVAISDGSGARLRRRLEPSLPGADWFEVGGGTIDDAVRLADGMKASRYDAIVGLGGGKVIDCAKFAAARVGLPMVAVATNLSHDGICSPVSILDNDAGRGSYGVPTPIALVVDLAVIREVPIRFVRAPGSVTPSPTSPRSPTGNWPTGSTARRSTASPPPWPGRRARPCCATPGGCGDDGFLTVLTEGLVLSGIAMSIAEHTRPSSGACHEISHALDLLYPRRAASHGEQVGMGAAFATYLRGDHEGSLLMAGTLRRHGLPVVAQEIGLDDEKFAQAVEFAPQTRPGRYTVLEHLDLSPARAKEAYAEYVAAVTE